MLVATGLVAAGLGPPPLPPTIEAQDFGAGLKEPVGVLTSGVEEILLVETCVGVVAVGVSVGVVSVGDWGVLISEDEDVGEAAAASEEGGQTVKEG